MLIVLSKFLAMPLYPIGLVILLSIAGIVLLILDRRRIGIVLVAAAALVLTLFSSPSVAYVLVRGLESRYDPPATYPAASAIVLLGGAAVPPVAPRRFTETNEFGDRVMHAARLFKKGLAPYLIVSGGKLPFIRDFPGSEAQITADLLTELFEVDSSKIILETLARNTRDHAPLIDSILRARGLPREIIVVTTASHMTRSVKVFEKQGLTVYPAPTDYYADKTFVLNAFQLFPRSDALEQSTMALHEIYGMIAYKMLGWI